MKTYKSIYIEVKISTCTMIKTQLKQIINRVSYLSIPSTLISMRAELTGNDEAFAVIVALFVAVAPFTLLPLFPFVTLSRLL